MTFPSNVLSLVRFVSYGADHINGLWNTIVSSVAIHVSIPDWTTRLIWLCLAWLLMLSTCPDLLVLLCVITIFIRCISNLNLKLYILVYNIHFQFQFQMILKSLSLPDFKSSNLVNRKKLKSASSWKLIDGELRRTVSLFCVLRSNLINLFANL